MKSLNNIKLGIARNWTMPGKERLASWLIEKDVSQNKEAFEGITWLKDEAIALHISTSSYIEWKILAEGNYESATGKLINLSLQPGEVAMDIGANIGVHTLRMAKSVGPNGKVLSCEPMPHLQSKLKKNVVLNKLDTIVSIIPKAVSDFEGKTRMKGLPENFNQGTGRMDENGDIETEVITGDKLLEGLNLNRLDLVKIDIEGYEMKAINGLKNSLKTYRPRLLVEYDRDYWKKCDSSWEEFFNLMTELNYHVYKIETFTLTKIEDTPNVTSCNVFCLPI
jgi:FkbM family methyltransferase